MMPLLYYYYKKFPQKRRLFIKEQETPLLLGGGYSCTRCEIQATYLVRHVVPILYEQVAEQIANIIDK